MARRGVERPGCDRRVAAYRRASPRRDRDWRRRSTPRATAAARLSPAAPSSPPANGLRKPHLRPPEYRHVTENSHATRRKPRGDRALAGAERQALYRARNLRGDTSVPISRHPKPLARGSRPQRWRAAVAELIRLQAEYAAWLEAMPEALKASAVAGALEAILDLDLDELSAVEPPRGFGRD
jgi:hypothetical protein